MIAMAMVSANPVHVRVRRTGAGRIVSLRRRRHAPTTVTGMVHAMRVRVSAIVTATGAG